MNMYKFFKLPFNLKFFCYNRFILKHRTIFYCLKYRNFFRNEFKERIIMSKLRDQELHMHKLNSGKLEVKSKEEVKKEEDLSLQYSPDVAEPCKEIFKNNKIKHYICIN